MKRIAWHPRCALTAAIFCGSALAAALALQPPKWRLYAALASVAGLVAVFLFFTGSKKYSAARLIVENQILHIQPAVLRKRDGREKDEIRSCETVEVFVSCFGILLGSKVIKFNQEGIRLKAVRIGRDDLSLDYGRETETRTIRLMYANPGGAALGGMIEKFRYETGVTPTMIH